MQLCTNAFPDGVDVLHSMCVHIYSCGLKGSMSLSCFLRCVPTHFVRVKFGHHQVVRSKSTSSESLEIMMVTPKKAESKILTADDTDLIDSIPAPIEWKPAVKKGDKNKKKKKGVCELVLCVLSCQIMCAQHVLGRDAPLITQGLQAESCVCVSDRN